MDSFLSEIANQWTLVSNSIPIKKRNVELNYDKVNSVVRRVTASQENVREANNLDNIDVEDF